MNLDLRKKILSDKYNSIIFKKSKGKEIYIVGGYIRDLFRGISSNDRDFLFNNNDIDKFVKKLNEVFKGTLVFFKKGNLRRIVLRNGITFDFSKPLGNLYEDLSKRDFTINSIAWSPKKNIVDPFNGLSDIQKKIIRCISSENITSDPLRIIRAYRFAAQLNGSIERKTRIALKTLCEKLYSVAAERITLEFFNLLNQKYSEKYIKMALKDGVLNKIIPLNKRVLERNIRVIYKLENKTFKILPYKFKVLLNKIVCQNLTYKGLLCLEALLRNYEYEVDRLKLCNAIKKRIRLFQKGLEEIEKKKDFKKNLFDLFIKSDYASPDLLIVEGKLEVLKDYERFKKIMEKGLLKSEELIRAIGIKQGPQLGKIILELKKAQFEGKIKSKNQAIKILHNISYRTFKINIYC